VKEEEGKESQQPTEDRPSVAATIDAVPESPVAFVAATTGAVPESSAAPAESATVASEQTVCVPAGEDAGMASLEQFARLDRRLEEALRLAKHRDELVDKLHRENQQLRQGELQIAMLPLLRDLMRLLDDLELILESDPEASDVDFVRGALVDILGRNGITGFVPAKHEPFDSAIHAAVGTEPTAERLSDRTVCTVRRGGFRRDDGSIVRVADVTVHRYQPVSAVEESPGDDSRQKAVEPPTEASAGDDTGQNIDEERT
jgi:molecular chaperone GrpE (heat shock protein)